MAKDFEDMRAVEWPVELEKLHRAANTAYETFAELDDLLDAKAEEDRGYIIELTGRAYALLRDLRAEGMRQLAAWEERQKVELATEDDPEPEWEIQHMLCCPSCQTGLVAVGEEVEGEIIECACERKFVYGVVAGGVLIGNAAPEMTRGWYVFEHITTQRNGNMLGLWKPAEMVELLMTKGVNQPVEN